MVIHMKLSNLFITGCDSKTKWQLDWFTENFYTHNPTANLSVYDFDTSFEAFDGWFKKPAAMVDASRRADKVCWIDTDCEVLGPLDSIWEYTQPNKLSMVEDIPWSKRRGETWHNSGVVLFENRPNILDEWYVAVKNNPKVGDQEVLHEIVKEGFRRDIHIHSLPTKYNVLRLMTLDGMQVPDTLIRHHTGAKGKDHIKRLIQNV